LTVPIAIVQDGSADGINAFAKHALQLIIIKDPITIVLMDIEHNEENPAKRCEERLRFTRVHPLLNLMAILSQMNDHFAVKVKFIKRKRVLI
jgi:hypothetical protein